VVPNHLLDVPDPNACVVRRCQRVNVEVVVRGYLTGSLWRDVQEGKAGVYGVPIPPGMKKDAAFERPIITPSTKEEVGKHDEPISAAALVQRGLCSRRDWDQISEVALAVFAEGQKWAASRGLILVDTKYEFGVDPKGRVVLIDEIHTPDSSRFWFAKSYSERMSQGKAPESFDKEYVRRWLADQGYKGDGPSPTLPDDVRVEAARRYIEACEAIRGDKFEPDLNPPHERLAKNLRSRAS
jgi:phosphoribosylaminoimidazole-succinocarboxamide synthase